jgi:hypothetical protein
MPSAANSGMMPERWEQIERLYQAARDRAPAERESFVKNACSGNERLRQEVQSLLAYESRSAGFMEAPALQVAADAILASNALEDSSDDCGRCTFTRSAHHCGPVYTSSWGIIEKSGIPLVPSLSDPHTDVNEQLENLL